MYIIEFQPTMDGVKREAIPKEKVNGYTHTESCNIHFYSRGHISYMVDCNNGCTLEKYDYSKACYLPVDYNDFHHFINIKRGVNNV